MSTVDKLARTKPKENVGSKSSNRFEYQINWGLKLLLKKEEANEEYIMSLRGDKYKYAWSNYRYISC